MDALTKIHSHISCYFRCDVPDFIEKEGLHRQQLGDAEALLKEIKIIVMEELEQKIEKSPDGLELAIALTVLVCESHSKGTIKNSDCIRQIMQNQLAIMKELIKRR